MKSCSVNELLLANGRGPFADWLMALTRDFEENVAARVQTDPTLAQTILDEVVARFVNGEPESAKPILLDQATLKVVLKESNEP